MNYKKLTEELKSLAVNGIISASQVMGWLEKHSIIFYDAVKTSPCGKWNRWGRTKEEPFPCCCSVREEDCIFIEFYYELLKYSELHKKEEFYAEQLVRFNYHKYEKESVIEWVRDNKYYYNDLKHKFDIDSVGLVVSVNTKKQGLLLVKINLEDFKHGLEIKRIFDEMRYIDYI